MVRNAISRRGRSLAAWWKSLRFGQLLVFIVAALMLSPLRMSRGVLSFVLQFLFLNALIVSLSASHGGPAAGRALLLGLWGAGAALKIAHAASGNPALQEILLVANGAVDAVLLTGCVVVVLRVVLRSRDVSSETIFAAVVAYFLMTLAFASGFDLLARVDPASFHFPGDVSPLGDIDLRDDLVYFSFVTIATLGYGDIVPVTPLAKVLCSLEAVVGQFYIAVIIAWLVSVYAARRRG